MRQKTGPGFPSSELSRVYGVVKFLWKVSHAKNPFEEPSYNRERGNRVLVIVL